MNEPGTGTRSVSGSGRTFAAVQSRASPAALVGATNRLHDDRRHDRRELHNRLIRTNWAVRCDLCQRRGVGDRLALEPELAGVLIDVHRRTLVDWGVRGDTHETEPHDVL